MPGRGTPWRKGGHVDDTIQSADIEDGTIQEVDLDSALQAKVNTSGGHVIQEEGTPLTQQSNLNFTGAGVTASVGGEDTTIVTIPGGGGGGNWEKIADFSVSSDSNTQNIPFSRTVALDGSDVSKVVVIIDFKMSAGDPILYDFNATGGSYTTKGIAIISISGISETGTGIFTDKAMNTGAHVEIIAQGKLNDAGSLLFGTIRETGDVVTLGGTLADWKSSASFAGGLSSIQLKTGGTDLIEIGTRVTAYAVTKN